MKEENKRICKSLNELAAELKKRDWFRNAFIIFCNSHTGALEKIKKYIKIF